MRFAASSAASAPTATRTGRCSLRGVDEAVAGITPTAVHRARNRARIAETWREGRRGLAPTVLPVVVCRRSHQLLPLRSMRSPRTLICGSLARDTIMVFPDRFSRHILPEQTHMLSVSFQIGEMRQEWGGMRGQYRVQPEGDRRRAGGHGHGRRGRRRVSRSVSPHSASRSDGLRTVPERITAQAFIITDLDDNQITAFHPGAMNQSHLNHVSDVDGIALGIVAPDGKRRDACRTCAGSRPPGIPFMFDPGQGLPLFSGDELIEMIDAADYVAVNDYEGRLLSERTGLAAARHRRARGGTDRHAGGDGSRIYCRRRGDRRAADPAVGGRRSDRLRRRLPRRTALRHRARMGLAAHRATRDRSWDRCQDRLAWWAESNVDRDQLAAMYAAHFGGALW